MLIELMNGIAIFYYWTWFIWPFVFVFTFASGIAQIIKTEQSSDKIELTIAAISLLIILAGIATPTLG